ncbi:MAG: tetratricopeptide repeat protein [Candidatus Krumholzibacteriia bacterium]
MLVLLVIAAGAAIAAGEPNPLDPAGAPAPVRRAVFRAEAAFARGEVGDAVAVLTDALADHLDHPAVRYRLGAYLLELGRAADAVPHLARASEQAPTSAAVWTEYARAAYESGAYAVAAGAFVRAHELRADALLLYYGGVAWILADRPADAVDVLAPLVASAPDTVPRDWVQALVSAAAAAAQPARAAAAVQRLVRDHPDARAAWLLASQQSQLAEDYATAALRMQVADWLAPLGAADRRHLADLYGAAALPRLAARQYARLWPDDARLARPLAVAWLQAHEPDSARVVLSEAVAGDPSLWGLLGDVEYEAERWEAARRAYAAAVAADPDAARSWLMLGACALKLGDEAAAREALGRAAGFARTEGEARRLLGQVGRVRD